MGDVVAAVDRYTDIPCRDARQARRRAKNRQYEDVAVIEREAIRGKAEYEPRSATCTSARQHLPHRHPREVEATTQERGPRLLRGRPVHPGAHRLPQRQPHQRREARAPWHGGAAQRRIFDA